MRVFATSYRHTPCAASPRGTSPATRAGSSASAVDLIGRNQRVARGDPELHERALTDGVADGSQELAALGCVGAGASVAAATKPGPTHKVTICHATASRSNPYVSITVDIASIVGGSGHGHSGVNAGDIIPPFDIAGNSYAGNNWDAAHQAIFDAGCETPSAEDTTTTVAPDTTTTTTEVTIPG